MAKKTLSRDEHIIALNAKIQDVTASYDAFHSGVNRAGEKVSPNTCRTQMNLLSRERKTLKLIRELISLLGDEFQLDIADAEFLDNVETFTGSRVTYVIEVKENDTVMDIMLRYPKAQNLLERMNKAAEKAGLRLEGMKFVRK